MSEGAQRREALKFMVASAAAVAATAVAVPRLPVIASSTVPGVPGDYDYIVVLANGIIEAYDATGILTASGTDWGAVVNSCLARASPNGVWIHTKEGTYVQSSSVAIPSGYNAPVTLSGEGMARTPQAKYTSPRPSTIIKNTTVAGRIVDTPNSGAPALFIRDITLFNSGGGGVVALNLVNAMEGGISRVMVTQVDPTVPFVAEPHVPSTGSIGINLGTGTGKNLFRIEQAYIINYDTGLLVNTDWLVADQIEFNWCNSKCVDIEGGFYQEFRLLHGFDCGGNLLYNNKPLDLTFERELTTVIGLADEGKGPTGYAAKGPSVNNVRGGFMLILGTFNPAGTGQPLVSGQLANTYGILTNFPSSGGGTLLPGPLSVNANIKTVTGPTFGNASYTMPFAGPSYKKFLLFLNGYQNLSGSPQTISFPIKFSQIPLIVADATSKASVTANALSLPSSMTSPVTGWIVIEGY